MTLISPDDSPWPCYLPHEQEPGDGPLPASAEGSPSRQHTLASGEIRKWRRLPATSYPLKTQKDGWTDTGRTDTVPLAPRRGSWLDASPHSPQLPSGKSPRRNGSSADLAHLGLLQTPHIHRAVTPVRNTGQEYTNCSVLAAGAPQGSRPLPTGESAHRTSHRSRCPAPRSAAPRGQSLPFN